MPSHHCSPESRFSKVFGTVLPVKCATRARFAGLPGPMSLFTAQGMPVVGMLKALFLVALLGFGFVVASADAQTSRDYAVRDLRVTQRGAIVRVEWDEPARKMMVPVGYRITYRTDDGQSPNRSGSLDNISTRDGRGRFRGDALTSRLISSLERGRRYLVTVEPLTGVSRGIGVLPDTAVSKRITMTSSTFSGNFAGTVTEDGNSTATGNVTLSSAATLAAGELTARTGTYGTFSLRNVSGQQYTWTYTLNNDDPDTNELPQGATRFENFEIRATRGGSTEQIPVHITVRGADDKPTVVAAPGDMGLERTIEDRSGTRITGTVASFTDVDTPGNRLTPESSDPGRLDIVIVDPGDGSQHRTSFPGVYALSTNYGRFGFVANGSGGGFWSYRLTNFNVPPGTSVTETFHLPAEGRYGLSTQTANAITITINGVDEDARFDPATSRRFLTEDADADAMPKEDGTAKGRVRLVDPDTSTPPLVVPQGGDDPRGRKYKYGWFKIDAEGNWTYTLDDNDRDTQLLTAVDKANRERETITVVAASDPNIRMGIDIIIQGKDDGGAVTGDVEKSIREGDATVTGQVRFTDDDMNNDGAMFETEVSPATGTYGSLTITSAGAWTYTLDNDDGGATDKLAGGEEMTDTFTVKTVNDDSGEVTITITGVNDPATIGGAMTGAITEDADPNTTRGTVTSSDVDGNDNVFKTEVSPNDGTTLTTGTGTYGTLTISSAGAWTYTLGNSAGGPTDLLDGTEDPKKTDVFTIMAEDGTEADVTITITGTNDPAILNGSFDGSVTEDAARNTATGTVTSTDVDGNNNVFKTEVSPTTGTYGSLTITTAGVWTYTLDNSDGGATDMLDGTEDPKKTDAFTIMAEDGTEAMVTITITGVDDPTVIAGTTTGMITEDAAPNTTTGTVTSTDRDDQKNNNVFKTEVSPNDGTTLTTGTGTYGTFTITTAGVWTYTLDNSDEDTNGLNGSEDPKKADVFTIMAADGTEATVTITITGVNDPAVIGGVRTGSITEDFMPANPADRPVRGRITITDPDNDNKMRVDDPDTEDDGVPRQDSLKNRKPDMGAPDGYGTLVVHESGIWEYYLNNDLPVIQKLGGNGSLSLTDTFDVLRTVGGDEVTITITIFGANDPAEIEVEFDNGDDEVTEDSDFDTGVSGIVTVDDVDEGEDNFLALESGEETRIYGDFSFTPGTGVWSYELDAVRSDPLRGGQKATDSLTITTTDGTTGTIVVNVIGTNDAALIDPANSTATITEDVLVREGKTIIVNDVDSGESFMTEQLSSVQGTYGTFTISREGAWDYTLDDSPRVNALKGGQTVTDTFPITSLDGTALFDDGTPAQVVITIEGTTDFEIIDEDGRTLQEAPEVTEDGDADQTTIGGQVNLTDSDTSGSDMRSFVPQPGTGDSDVDSRGVKTTYGFFTIDAEGNWTYTLDNENHEVNRLAEGDDPLMDTIRIDFSDGTHMSLVITVKGAALNADTARITTSLTQLQITEGGEPGQYMVIMTEPPAGTVTITPMSSDTAMATVSGPVEFRKADWTDANEGKPVGKPVTVTPGSAADDDEFRGIRNLTISHSIAIEDGRDAVYNLDEDKLAELDVAVKIADDEVDPILVPITGYLQDRAGTLLDNQPGLTQLLRGWQIRGALGSVEGDLSMQASEDTLGFKGSFVGDGVWGQLSAVRSGLDDDVSSNDSDSLFGALGAYRSVSETALAGLMLQFDSADARLDADQGIIEGQVWLLGPYLVARHQTQPLTFDGRLLYGQSDNDIRFTDEVLGLRTGSFDTTIWLASLRVEGEVLLDYANRDVRVVPHLDIDWIEDEAAPFTDDGGNPVPGQTVRLQELALGSDVELPLRFGQRDATISGGLSVILTREESWVDGATRLPAVSDTFGRARFGLDYQLNPRVRLEFGGSYEGIEASDSGSDTDRYNLTFGLRSTF